MISRSSLAHVRVPLSFYLLPIFLCALFCVEKIDIEKALVAFITLHFFLYPASNGFNSFYDRDIESIGTLKRPPPVKKDLLWFSLALDAIALALGLLVGTLFAAGCLIYGCASKAYSWDKIRIKKYPLTGWLFTGLGQGTLTFLLVAVSVGTARAADVFDFHLWFPALACGLFVLGFFPLTQVFQHREDARRHDTTISMLIGVRGTFFLAAIILFLALSAFFFYFEETLGMKYAGVFFILLFPAAVSFLRWFGRIYKDAGAADYDHATRICLLASGGMNIFFLIAIVLSKTE
jgi:1,4-dihydroxy-2-naphthoate octaprenyltransferase